MTEPRPRGAIVVEPVVERAAPRGPSSDARRMLATLTDALQDDRREKIAVCRVIARLLVSDGPLDAAEQAFLAASLERHGLGPGDLGSIEAGSLDDDLRAIPAAGRAELLRYLESAAALDDTLAPEEAAILDRVRAGR